MEGPYTTGLSVCTGDGSCGVAGLSLLPVQPDEFESYASRELSEELEAPLSVARIRDGGWPGWKCRLEISTTSTLASARMDKEVRPRRSRARGSPASVRVSEGARAQVARHGG